MIVYGTSHALASVVAMVSSAYLSDLAREKLPFLKGIAIRLAHIIHYNLGIAISIDSIFWLMLTAFFAFIWGACFKSIHRN